MRCRGRWKGALLAIADKADTIAGMFGLGLEPTGSKDPFALRRAANGIVKILAESAVALPLTLGDVVDAAGEGRGGAAAGGGFLCGAAGVLSARGEGTGL